MKTVIVFCLAGFLFILATVMFLESFFNLKTQKKFEKDPKSVPTQSGGFVINKKTMSVEGGSDKPLLPFPNATSLIRWIILIIGTVILGFIVFS